MDLETIGLDIGAGALKLWDRNGGLQFPAQVSEEASALIDQTAFGFDPTATNGPVSIAFGGHLFYCSHRAHYFGAPTEDWGHDRFDSVPIRALVYAALTKVSARTNAPLRLVLGVPQGIAIGDGAQERLSATRKWLIDDGGEHHWVAGGVKKRARIAEALVTSQPRGALVDVITDAEGNVTKGGAALHRGRVGVISIGFNTLELLAVDNGAPLPVLASGEMLGVRHMLKKLNPAKLITAGQMDADVRLGRVPLNGHLPTYGRQVVAHIADVWGNQWRNWDGVAVVGGGAVLLADPLRSLFGDKLVPVDDPVLCTARGLYKLGLQAERKSGRESGREATSAKTSK